MHSGDITIKNIAKTEGHSDLHVKINNGTVEKVEFKITEYKRFYTWAIKGKNINALSQAVARICGTCSIAHLLCSIEAIEKAIGLKPSAQTVCLRHLLMNGLMIRDHALHLYLFALPDYLHKDSILEFDENNPLEHELLHDAFALKKAGNNLSTWIGGRAVHAMYPKVGGFLKYPDPSQKQSIIDELKAVRGRVLRVLDIFVKDEFNFTRETNFAALVPDDYNFLEGKLRSTHGWEIEEDQYLDHLEHVVLPYSMASGYKLDDEPYMIGALARMNLNKENLHSNTKKDLGAYINKFPSNDIFLNNLAQGIEIMHCIDYSIELLENFDIKEEASVPVVPKKSSGVGVIEAPRGLLFYKLDVDENGIIEGGKIIVPTAQNQINIEADVKKLVEDNIDKDRSELEHMIEMLIRAYDPCMSCASHFLKFKWDEV